MPVTSIHWACWHQSEGALLCESFDESLKRLHEYQQYRYCNYRLSHQEVETFRACKQRLWETRDCVPDIEKLERLKFA